MEGRALVNSGDGIRRDDSAGKMANPDAGGDGGSRRKRKKYFEPGKALVILKSFPGGAHRAG
jgi:hypothetical protein